MLIEETERRLLRALAARAEQVTPTADPLARTRARAEVRRRRRLRHAAVAIAAAIVLIAALVPTVLLESRRHAATPAATPPPPATYLAPAPTHQGWWLIDSTTGRVLRVLHPAGNDTAAAAGPHGAYYIATDEEMCRGCVHRLTIRPDGSVGDTVVVRFGDTVQALAVAPSSHIAAIVKGRVAFPLVLSGNGGGREVVAGMAAASELAWSPTGNQLVVRSGDDLYVVTITDKGPVPRRLSQITATGCSFTSAVWAFDQIIAARICGHATDIVRVDPVTGSVMGRLVWISQDRPAKVLPMTYDRASNQLLLNVYGAVGPPYNSGAPAVVRVADGHVVAMPSPPGRIASAIW